MREMYAALIRARGQPFQGHLVANGSDGHGNAAFERGASVALREVHVLMYGRDKIFDSTKARAKLGWTPRYSNTEMLCEAYDWFCANYEKIRSDTGRPLNSRFIRQGVLGVLKWLGFERASGSADV